MTHDPALPLGSHMRREMAEQPRNLRDLVDDFDATAAQVAHLVRGGIAGVAFLARGSSDNAALLGRYATEIESGRPTSLIAPSVSTAFGSPEHYVRFALSTPRRIWSRSIDSNSARKLPSPNPSLPLRSMISKKIGPITVSVNICNSSPCPSPGAPSIRI